MAGGFIQAVSVVINFIGVVDNRKAEKYEVTFAQIIDLLLRDCFLIGMEIGKTPMPNEAKEILAFVGEPLVEFIYRLFSDGFRLGLAPKDDIARITRTTLEQTYMVCKQTYDFRFAHFLTGYGKCGKLSG